jgi:hypothetical protein
LDREHIEEYARSEHEEYDKFLKRIKEGTFDFEADSYPQDERFVKLQRPVALCTSDVQNIWAQVPLCGSLIVPIMPLSQDRFEKEIFTTREIPRIIDFIKDTGKIQLVLTACPHHYEGLDYLDLIFEELNPPRYLCLPIEVFYSNKETQEVREAFNTISNVSFMPWLKKIVELSPDVLSEIPNDCLNVYTSLKLDHYSLAEDIENLMIDDPAEAFALIFTCKQLIVDPFYDRLSNVTNMTIDEIGEAKKLPLVYQPQEVAFPCEIGKFLLRKLTYAPEGLEACKELIYHHSRYDLQKVFKSLNEAIVTNHPDIASKSAEELSEILDNIWNDKTISKRIENIKIGVPISIAAIGGIVAGLPGLFASGFLSELGFKVVEKTAEKYAEKLFGVKGEGLTERLAKLRTKSYQANVYDFKKKIQTSDRRAIEHA